MSDVTLGQIQRPEGSPVPVGWQAAMAHLHAAQVARDGMRNPDATGQMRDEATCVHSWPIPRSA